MVESGSATVVGTSNDGLVQKDKDGTGEKSSVSVGELLNSG